MKGYSKDILKDLINANTFFSKSAEERYKLFKHVDPFPDISAALLNSEDVIKYIMTTGMIDPFNIGNLSGATYACEISGEYNFWNENKVLNSATLKGDNELRILPNSITFIAIKQYFRIPSYIVLRFNLRVSHVYKGLLLGTGPIVDPCFEGQLFIPLHNLTSNSYIIKKNALIIDVEFTKMSKNSDWDINKFKNDEQKKIVDNLIFNNIKYRYDTEIKPGRVFAQYIDKALAKDPLFRKDRPDEIYINSSLTEEVHNFRKDIKQVKEYSENQLLKFDTTMKDSVTQIKVDSNRMVKTETYVKSFTFIAFLSVFVACAGLTWSTLSFLTNSNRLSDAQKKNEILQGKFDDARNTYYLKTDEMQKRIDDLEKKIGGINNR